LVPSPAWDLIETLSLIAHRDRHCSSFSGGSAVNQLFRRAITRPRLGSHIVQLAPGSRDVELQAAFADAWAGTRLGLGRRGWPLT